MSIFARPRPPVKRTRSSPFPDRPFGEGILPAGRARFIPSDADLAWAAYVFNKDATDFDVVGPTDAELDFEAGCALAQARMDAGYSLF
jgi:hypothetical protein